MEDVRLTHQYSRLSRGRISAKHSDGHWGSKDDAGGVVTIDAPGKWMLSATDGFARKETIYVTFSADGAYSLPGSSRFEEV